MPSGILILFVKACRQQTAVRQNQGVAPYARDLLVLSDGKEALTRILDRVEASGMRLLDAGPNWEPWATKVLF